MENTKCYLNFRNKTSHLVKALQITNNNYKRCQKIGFHRTASKGSINGLIRTMLKTIKISIYVVVYNDWPPGGCLDDNLFCRKLQFLIGSHCQFLGVYQGMKQTQLYLWYLFFKLSGIAYQQTQNYLVKGHDLHIAERDIKSSGQLLLVFPQKPLYEVCLVRIKEQVGEKGC